MLRFSIFNFSKLHHHILPIKDLDRRELLPCLYILLVGDSDSTVSFYPIHSSLYLRYLSLYPSHKSN
jgi:hypothetical protein